MTSPLLPSLLNEVLPTCAPEIRESLLETARIVTAAKGDTIYWQGEPVPLTLLLRGHAAFRRTTLDGQHVTVGIDRPGQMDGFASIASTHGSVSLVALTTCEVAIWHGLDLRRLVRTDPGFALDVIDRLSVDLNAMTERVDGFLHQDARRRVLRVLARHRDLLFEEPAVLSRSDLPSMVGTSREMTGRVLRELERDGTVARVGRAGLRLLRPDRLDEDANRFAQETS